jgi:hypothetical protein
MRRLRLERRVIEKKLTADAITAPRPLLAADDEATFDEFFSRYTMERERYVHREFLRGFGLAPREPAQAKEQGEIDDGLLLF